MPIYDDLINRSINTSNAPYTPYGGEEVAPLSDQQGWAIDTIAAGERGIGENAGNAGSMINNAGQAVNAGDINAYMDPYTQSVIDATQKDFDVQNKRAKSATDSQSAMANAWGGDRAGVAEALTREGEERVQAPVIANLRSQGFTNAEQMANQQKARELAAGTTMNQQDIASANAAFALGTAKQQTQQAQDTQAMTDYYTKQGYPFATAQWLASMLLPTGSAMGSTTNAWGQGPQPNQWLQGAGGLFAGLGALGQAGGSGGIPALASWLMASDKRLKENIKEVGRLHDGQKIYRFNFKGDPTTHIGLISQEVEKKHPHAVGKIAGFGAVDYDEATKDAIKKWSGGAIRGFADGGFPDPEELMKDPEELMKMSRAPVQLDKSYGLYDDTPTLAQSFRDEKDIFRPHIRQFRNLEKEFETNLLVNGPHETHPPVWVPEENIKRGGRIAGFAEGGTPEDLLSSMPFDLGPLNLPPIHPESKYGAGESSLYFPGDPKNESSQRWLSEPSGLGQGRMLIRRPGTRAAGGTIRGFAAGGNPYGQLGQGWVPTVGNIPVTPLPAAKAPNMQNLNPQGDVTKGMAKGLADAIKAARGTGPSSGTGSDHNWDTDPVGGLDNPALPEGSWAYADGGTVKRKGFAGGGVPISSGWAGGLSGDLPDEDLSSEPPIRYGGTWDRATDDTAHILAEAEGDVPSLGFAPDTEGSVAAAAKKIIRPAAGSDFPAGDTEDMSARSRLAARGVAPQDDPEARRSAFNQALMSLGFGMMSNRVGGRGSFLAGVGQGGEQAMGTYASSLAATAAQRAQERKEAFEREKFEAPYNRMTLADQVRERHQRIMDARENLQYLGNNDDGYPIYLDKRTGKETTGTQKIQQKAPQGYVRNPDGTMSAIKGGPADPEIIAGLQKAKAGSQMGDATADFLAERVIAGDGKALVGLGRGAQGAENILRVQGLVAQKAAERGLNASDLLAKVAEQSGLTASQRTFGTNIARMAVNSTEANGAIEQALDVSRNVPRFNWVGLNKFLQLGKESISDPDLAEFHAANMTVINTYARAINPTGIPHDSDKAEARRLISTATSQEAYERVMHRLQKEIEIAHSAPAIAKREMERIRKSSSATQETTGKSEKDEAIEWIKANPDDPRIPDIKKKLGIE